MVLRRLQQQSASLCRRGVNYTTFFDNDFNDNGSVNGPSDLELKDSRARQGKLAGVDYLINRDWLIGALSGT